MTVNLEEVAKFLQDPKNAKAFQELMGASTSTKKGRGRPKKTVVEDSEAVVDLVQSVAEIPDAEGVEVVDLTKGGRSGASKGKLCRTVAIKTENRKNKFKDNGIESREDYENFDKKVMDVSQLKPKIKKKPIRYKVKCRDCKEIFIVDERPVSFEAGVEGSASYVCDGCIPGR